MDMFELERRERWAELADSIAQADRNNEARARRHSWLRFWFSPWQVVDGPDVPVPSPGAQAPSHTGVSAPPGLGTGAAGTHAASPPATHRPGLDSGSRIPGGLIHEAGQ